MHFAEFSKFLDTIEHISSRNEMTIALAEFIKKLEKEEIKETMYLLTGRLVPTFIALEFNFSEKLVIKALEEISNDKVQPARNASHMDAGGSSNSENSIRELFSQ